MHFVKKYKRIPDGKNPDTDPFSNQNLENAFHFEDQICYKKTDKIDGKIAHKSVLFIAHDIFKQIEAKKL